LLSILHKLYQIKNGEINDATNFYTTIKLYLRRTLVLQQFYSAIVVGACPRRSEGIFSFYLKRDPQRFKKRLFDLFNFKKNNRSGQRSCHYRARRDLNSFINNEKKYQQILSSYCQPVLIEWLTMNITKQPKHYNKNHNTSQTATSPFPSGIAGDQ
jgi:hypothetical protein